MKHFTAILFLLLASMNSAFAIHSFVNESKLWHCKKWKQGLTRQEDRYYYFQGDTVINGITAKKMYLKFSKESDKGNYQAALYEEGQKVYCCNPNQKGFELEYDFGAKKGEEVTTSSFTYMVEDVEEMKVGDETLRVLHLYILHDLLNEKYSVTWVEGVGSESAPCYSGPNFPGGYEYFIDCEIDGKVFLKAEDIPDHITPTQKDDVRISSVGQTLLCTSPTAVKLEVYTMDAVKVGEADFANGEATVKVGKVPATYLYIVTYPDGRRESGKVVVKD